MLKAAASVRINIHVENHTYNILMLFYFSIYLNPKLKIKLNLLTPMFAANIRSLQEKSLGLSLAQFLALPAASPTYTDSDFFTCRMNV